jgi:hypothetical protein
MSSVDGHRARRPTCGNLHLALQHRLLVVIYTLLHRHEGGGEVGQLHAVAVDDLAGELLIARVGPAALDVVDCVATKLSQLLDLSLDSCCR